MPNSRHADQAFFSSLVSTTDFFLVRHGESEGNAGNIIQGHMDFKLNDRGRLQANLASAWLADKGIKAMFSSPLSRARETAEIINAKLLCPRVTTDPSFKEIDTGIFSGRPLDESFRQYPEIGNLYLQSSWDAVPGAENSSSLFNRAMEAWTVLLAASKVSGNACLVTHGGFIQWLIRAVFGVKSWMPLLPTGNCCVYHLRVSPVEVGLPLVQWKHLNHDPSAHVPKATPVF